MKQRRSRVWLLVPLLLVLTSCMRPAPPRRGTRIRELPRVVVEMPPDTEHERAHNESDWPSQSLLTLAAELHEGAAEHTAQADLVALVQAGEMEAALELAFHAGDELFETHFNALDGVGANVGQGLRFTQIPRADLDGLDEWANHVPQRITGPNAEACNQCHNSPVDDGAGTAIHNNTRDPGHTGDASQFIVRSAPHVFALGALQVLAEEMTEELHAQREAAERQACATGRPQTITLTAKTVSFGELRVRPQQGTSCTVEFDTRDIVGIDPDLVVRPFQWKGVIASIRAFNRDASHQELGMQSVEIVGEGIDGDGDGVVNELTIGDQTALALYIAAQPRPTTLLELSDLALIEPLSEAERTAILQGEQAFAQSGCTHCHVPQLTMIDPVFYEPSQNPAYRDAHFPAGQDPVALGVDPALALALDLTRDQPDNQLKSNGESYHLGAFPSNTDGSAPVYLYGDMKRHDLGWEVAETIDDEGIPAAVFMTENLWGVGSTAPYLHDGRATTLTEAILAHGGEGAASRAAFLALTPSEQADVIAFLDNLILFKHE